MTKFNFIELLWGKKNSPNPQIIPKVTLLSILAILLFTVTPLSFPLFGSLKRIVFASEQSPSSSSATLFNNLNNNNAADSILLPSSSRKKCDIFSGEWVPNPEAPYYTNTSCWAIHEHQNCIKYGRPDSEFMKWRWKPNDCELPIFNPFQFLEIMRGKSMAFVGDSVGRNQMQSLICLLSRAEWPEDDSEIQDDYFRRWKYPSNNFTVAAFWTTHLVKSKAERNPNELLHVYVDKPDEKWSKKVSHFDYIVINGGHWFDKPMVFYEEQKIIGCYHCFINNITSRTRSFGYRKALKTALKTLNSLENFKGMTILRSFAPSHFENGLWNEGGDCVRRKPFKRSEVKLEGDDLRFYVIQMEEIRVAEEEAKKKMTKKKFRVLDVTQAMLMRPDGHPSRYGHWPHENVTLYNDCVHWCLPGPIDAWSDLLLEMLKIEGGN
ncbi:protein trichome birefringence-like 19 [Prosopis cineraria]|uniref:protein trichome birefringence-like 19 n=1 Tax=Prosopis cineraria TaxID=364024 RepID=UPI00240F0E83|nr:protein trichome birefringence-like 19 [Prosopis cineraria]